MEMKKDLSGNHIGNRAKPLTKREIATLINRANGLTLEETAAHEHVSGHTIKTRLRLATYKLGARGTTNAVAIAMAVGLIRSWQITPGDVPLHVLQESNGPWVEQPMRNVRLGSSIHLSVAELQLIEHGPAPDGKIRLQLSGWLKEPCPALFSIQEVVLTEAILPGRIVPVGQRVKVRAVERGDAYGVGVYVSLRWPKEQ